MRVHAGLPPLSSSPPPHLTPPDGHHTSGCASPRTGTQHRARRPRACSLQARGPVEPRAKQATSGRAASLGHAARTIARHQPLELGLRGVASLGLAWILHLLLSPVKDYASATTLRGRPSSPPRQKPRGGVTHRQRHHRQRRRPKTSAPRSARLREPGQPHHRALRSPPAASHPTPVLPAAQRRGCRLAARLRAYGPSPASLRRSAPPAARRRGDPRHHQVALPEAASMDTVQRPPVGGSPVDWDQALPTSATESWEAFECQLPELQSLSIPRRLHHGTSNGFTHLIGFCDASELGYAAAVYLRSSSPTGQTSVALLHARSKVAPLKQTSLPRLELCGAHLLAQLLNLVTIRLLPPLRLPIIAFCDSTVALAWIRGESHRWKTFVGNRVAAIQELLPQAAWRHIRSEDNPADCASRGMNPRDVLNHHLWWQGPDWLSLPLKAWPSSPAVVHPAEDVSAEEKATPSLLLLATTSPDGLEARFSSLTRMQRVLAYCQRFVHNARHPASRLAGHLSSAELQRALMNVVRQVQRISFAEEREEARQPSSRHRRVRQLHLFLDKHDILRVGGRLAAAPLQYAQRNPALLSKAHHLTTLIIDDAHHRLLHAGALATHAYIRQRFWIPDGRNVARLRLRACNRCFTFKPTPIIQPLGSLPPERVTAANAFLTTGVDYAGPFFITSARLRGAAVTKAYLVVFICFATKAVHFEVASELSSAAFIAAYRRFVARRGHPTVIFSDNGTNFVGAHHELRDLSRLLSSPKHQQSLSAAASTCGTDWRFIPPASPHFGGLWEAAVKSAKHHLRRTIGDQRLTYEEFLTICTQVEAILNSRPLVAPSNDVKGEDVDGVWCWKFPTN
ncbi:hypothetical protein KPH14_012648 [Odynerus spinipes]|uniref:Integrase catalytic domain-containing protein n=1 Tax=Odynerus spinipes TaxID=1348599 RepID=A0AAD9VLL5_9HYME|nr:hypothetical protein KPH14_012648 [Odynerus spinipes]